MPVPRHRDISIGTAVSIVLKADQRTGRQVTGTVAQLLTRGDHPHGVKVRLTDGRVGRVQQLTSSLPASRTALNTPASTRPFRPYSTMSSNNPWQSATSQGNPYTTPGEQPAQGQQQQQQPYNTNTGAAQGYYDSNQNQQFSAPPGPPPSQGVRRSDTDNLLTSQPDRAEQIEHMQNFEASAPQTQEDKDQAQLAKEFPDVDSSLIAALYSDTKDLSATREMLQELSRA